jgi:iron complex outermembrane recepter protein
MNRWLFILATALIAAFNVSHAAQLRQQQFQLSIERGPLASILEQLSHQTSVQVGAEFTVANSRGTHMLGPFVGRATVEEAIEELLRGTDLWYAWRDEDTIRLFLISTQRMNWSSGVSTAKEASHSIWGLAGVHYGTGSCSELLVGPFSTSEPITAEAFWVELIKRHCRVIRTLSSDIKPGSFDRQTIAGQTEHDFSIQAMSRIAAFRRISQQAGVVVRYLSTDVEEELALVGSISGPMPLSEALSRAMRGSVLRARWVANDIVTIEPAYTMVTYADMSKCPCNFGLPELRPLETAHISVIKPRLPSLEENSPAPVAVFDRTIIEASGAATIPELLNELPQQAFSRSRGYRSNAAQYFEGRGFGAQYSLILIDGHRVYGNASDPITNAFDLSVIPVSAVERIEIALDQPSVLNGTDAIGGTVNIVLRQDLEEGGATLSVGSARGGSEKRSAALFAGGRWRGTKTGFVFDRLVRGDLLGSQRDRWRNQDYTRYPNGRDYRLPYGAPPNVHSVAGNLPGTDASSAAIVFEQTEVAVRPNQTNMESALAHAAILPEQERSSLYTFASTTHGNAELRLGVLLGRQTVSLQLFPVEVPGLIWGARHPQNPFGVDVVIEALLTGLPPRRYEVDSTMTRVTGDVSGSVGGWEYSVFMVGLEDRSRAWLTHEVDPSVLAHSLTTEDPAAALNVLSNQPGEGRLPPDLLLPARGESYFTGAVQYGLNLSGSLFEMPAGKVSTEAGIAHRQETVRVDATVGTQRRDVSSIFSRLRIPIISGSSASSQRSLELAIGGRRDFHSDVRDITTAQYSLKWQPLSAIQIHAGYSELFRPPSLSELYLPRFSYPVQIFDPQRTEVALPTFVTGGNPSLHPTEGQSVNAGLLLNVGDGWRASLNCWETRMRDRISAVLSQDLLQAQADDVQGRILRAERTAADVAANIPGRLLALDATRANFGVTSARGFDVSFGREMRTSVSRITSGITISRTLDFRYRDLPSASIPMLDRAGVASVYGTVPSARAVASLIIERGGLRASLFARHHTSYKDYLFFERAATARRIPAQTLLDIKMTKAIGDHLTVSVGANNVLDDRQPFAQVGGWEGFDQSQGELVGREAFVDMMSSF